MSAWRDPDQLALLAADEKIVAITGERFHAYTSVPGDGQTRVTFADGTVKRGYRAGRAYAELMLAHLLAHGAHDGWKYALEGGAK